MPVAVRERIVRLYEEGQGTAEIAAFRGCCVAAVRRARQQFKARGTLEPQTHRCGRKTLLTPERRARLPSFVRKRSAPRELPEHLPIVDPGGAWTPCRLNKVAVRQDRRRGD